MLNTDIIAKSAFTASLTTEHTDVKVPSRPIGGRHTLTQKFHASDLYEKLTLAIRKLDPDFEQAIEDRKQEFSYAPPERLKEIMQDPKSLFWSKHYWDERNFPVDLAEIGFKPLKARVPDCGEPLLYERQEGHVLELKKLTPQERAVPTFRKIIAGLLNTGATFLTCGIAYAGGAIFITVDQSPVSAIINAAVALTAAYAAPNFAQNLVTHFKDAAFEAKNKHVGLFIEIDDFVTHDNKTGSNDLRRSLHPYSGKALVLKY